MENEWNTLIALSRRCFGRRLQINGKTGKDNVYASKTATFVLISCGIIENRWISKFSDDKGREKLPGVECGKTHSPPPAGSTAFAWC